jgi:hypothetical protein
MKIDWITEAGYRQRVEYFHRLRALFEELQFISQADEVLENHKVWFLDFDGDDFPRINLKRTDPNDENNTEEIC